MRVPVFIGHAVAVHAEFDGPITEEQAIEAFTEHPSISLVDHRIEEGYVTPEEVGGEDPVYISRLREDPSVAHGLCFWCVADNLRKGAALNTVQIAEELIKSK